GIAELKEGGISPVEDKLWEVALSGISKLDITKAILSKKKRLQLVNKVVSNINNESSLLDNNPLLNILLANTKIEDFKIPFFFGIVSLYTGKLYELSEK